MNLYESVVTNLKESYISSDLMNDKPYIRDILKDNGIKWDKEIEDFMNRLHNELKSKLTDDDIEMIKKYGGYHVTDLEITEPKHGTTEVVSSSFSEFMAYDTKCKVYWYVDGPEEEKSIDLNFTYKLFYNHYSGGWN